MTIVTKPANRCHFDDCRKKLQLTDLACRCQKIFCSLHRLPETHKCTFNHKEAEWSRLVTRLFDEQVTRPKVNMI